MATRALKSLTKEMPARKIAGKTTPVALDADTEAYVKRPASSSVGDAEAKAFWDGLASDLGKHKRRAEKLAETVRDTMVTKKVAGRTVPNSTHYTQTVTKTSKDPIKK